MRTRREFLKTASSVAGSLAMGERSYDPLAVSHTSPTDSAKRNSYAIVVNKDTLKNKDWREVVEVLEAKRGAKVVTFIGDVSEVIKDFGGQLRPPKYIAYVATPEELSIPDMPSGYSVQDAFKQNEIIENSRQGKFYETLDNIGRKESGTIHRVAIGGIITGANAKSAKELAQAQDFSMKFGLMENTKTHFNYLRDGVLYTHNKGTDVQKVRKSSGKITRSDIDAVRPDITKRITREEVDLIVSNGGEFERVTKSENPKTYLDVGDDKSGIICKGKESKALSWMRFGGVAQYIGYTCDRFRSDGGQDILDHLVSSDNPTIGEAFRMNTLASQRYFFGMEQFRKSKRLNVGEEGAGLLLDQRAIVLYGDPALETRVSLDPHVKPLVTKEYQLERIKEKGINKYTFSVTANSEKIRSPAVFLLEDRIGGPIEEPKKTSEFFYAIGPDFVVIDPFNEFTNDKRNNAIIDYKKVEKGKTYELEFSAQNLGDGFV